MRLKMHTTYTYTQEKKSLKNTKINYTKDLRHCLLIFWEDFCKFFFLCVLQVSILAKSVKSFFLHKSLPLLFFSFVHFKVSATSPHLGGKKRTVMTIPGDWSPVQ